MTEVSTPCSIQAFILITTKVCLNEWIVANVNHFFTLLGKMFFTPYGKEFFTSLSKQIFTS